MYSFVGLIRRVPPPTFSDTAITDRHSDTTIFQLRANWVRISWSIGSENRSDMCRRWASNPRLPAWTANTRPGAPLDIKRWRKKVTNHRWNSIKMLPRGISDKLTDKHILLNKHNGPNTSHNNNGKLNIQAWHSLKARLPSPGKHTFAP